MLGNCMTVKKKADKKNKWMEIFTLDCFVEKTGPVTRLAILDVADVKQRMQMHGWIHRNTRNFRL
jgi:hypothetical protein